MLIAELPGEVPASHLQRLGTAQAASALHRGLQVYRTLCKQAEEALPRTSRPEGNWPRKGHGSPVVQHRTGGL